MIAGIEALAVMTCRNAHYLSRRRSPGHGLSRRPILPRPTLHEKQKLTCTRADARSMKGEDLRNPNGDYAGFISRGALASRPLDGRAAAPSKTGAEYMAGIDRS